MTSLFEELGMDSETPGERNARELIESDRELVRALRRVRESRGLSQTALGELLGVSQATVSAFESGDADPQLGTIRRYALALGASVSHSVIADGVEFCNVGVVSASWTPSVRSVATSVGKAKPFAVGAAESKRSDFAVAA